MRRGPLATVVGAGALIALLLVWASGGRTPLLRAPQGGDVEVVTEEIEPADVAGLTAEPPAAENLDPGLEIPLDYLVYVFVAILLAVAVWLIRLVLRHVAQQEEVPEPSFDLPDDLDELIEATSQRMRSLALVEGDPRNAVVACWVALEDAAEHGGLDRSPAETAAEFTTRVLRRFEVHDSDLDRLAGLYREARFSAHPIGESTREEAVALLSRIHDHLVTRARQAREAREDAEREAAEAVPQSTGPGEPGRGGR